MTITKSDCVILLMEIKEKYPEKASEVDKYIKQVFTLVDIPLYIIKFINDNRELDIRAFYEKLRKNYNDKKSRLYKNIVNENELGPKELLCCLGALQQQILLFYKNVEDKSFLTHARFDSITQCLLNYYKTGDIIPCQRLLNVFKNDLKLLEAINESNKTN